MAAEGINTTLRPITAEIARTLNIGRASVYRKLDEFSG
jgi:hypothetical protein